MGAENSVLEGCEWHDRLESSLPWEIYPVTKPDGSAVTVFQAKRDVKKDGDLLRKNSLIIRSIRHPNIVRYVGGREAKDDVWLATESVRPLSGCLGELSSDEISAGLHDILQALEFLHSKLGMCHNNLSLPALFVAPDGTWKLGEMQHACKFSEATPAFLDQCRAFRLDASLSPEEKSGQVNVDPTTGHSRDMFAFGVLVENLSDNLKVPDDRLKSLESEVAACLSIDPKHRPTAASLLTIPLFVSDLFEIINYLKYVTMKTDEDKKEFFSHLVPRLSSLPEEVLARRLVIPLLARFVLLDEWADLHVIPSLLTPKTDATPEGLLSDDLFRQYVVPQLYNIFHVHDCHIRLVLLQHFSHYVSLFSQQQLNDDIFLQVLLGVRDSDDRVVAASLRALADMVPIMGGDVVVGAARKPFFFHGLPKHVDAEDMMKLSAQQNVAAMLSSNKPLGSVAGCSTSPSRKEVSAEERERKMKEREQRREEAKLKREERRKKLKEKKIEKEDEMGTAADKDTDGLTIEEVERLEAKLGNDDNNHLDLIKSTANVNINGNNYYSDDGLEINGTLRVKDNIDEDNDGLDEDEEEKEGPDWSDWEDADQKIEAEIEEELRNMSPDGGEGVHNGGGGPKVQTSPSPYRRQTSPPPPPPVSASWDLDTPEADRDMTAMSSDQGVAEFGDAISGIRDTSSDFVNVGSGSHTSLSKSLKLKGSAASSTNKYSTSSAANYAVGSSKSLTSVGSVKGKPLLSSDDLGAGLDIKSVEIKVKTAPELDFFADMAPSIKPSSVPTPLPVLPGEDSGITSVGSGLFAVSATPDEEGQDASGWGDDEDAIDWEGEDF